MYAEALEILMRKIGIDLEIHDLVDHVTVELISCPTDASIIGDKWMWPSSRTLMAVFLIIKLA